MLTLQITNGMAEIRLHRPPVNALDGAMLDLLEAALDRIEREGARVVLIWSDQKCFCAGADLAMIKGLFDAPDPAQAMRSYAERLHRLFNRLERLPAVSLAALAGPVLGGGLEFALACDLRLAAQDATLGLPEAAVGLLPGAGGTQRLARLCGAGTANRLILAAERVKGEEALRLGLVQWCVPAERLMDEARAIAARIAALAPAALRAAKTSIQAAQMPDRQGDAVEINAISGLMGLSETRARVEAFFARQKS